MPLRWGNADAQAIAAEHGEWLALADGEEIEFAAKTRRDLLIMTDRRLVRTDTQGFMNKKTEYVSMPYRAITRWSLESKGRGWKDGADLKIWLGSSAEPLLDIELQKDESGRDVAAVLSKHAL